MSENKRYYFLKLKQNFFDSNEMKILEAMPNGIYYSNLLLKLALLSLKENGKVMFNETIPYRAEMISTVTRINIDTVKKGVETLQSLGLIEILENGAIYLMQIEELIGKSSTEGDRKKRFRERLKDEKQLLVGGQMSAKCPHDVPKSSTRDKDIRDKEIRDKEIKNITYTQEFENFWSIYPERGRWNKEQTFKHWRVLISKNNVTCETLIRSAENYTLHCKDKNVHEPYFKRSTNFLGKEEDYKCYIEYTPTLKTDKNKRTDPMDIFRDIHEKYNIEKGEIK